MPKGWSKYQVDFFAFDSDFLRDVKIKRLRRQYGCNGIVIYLATICKMYETNGYYAILDENFIYDIADDVDGKYAPTEDVVRAVIEFCIEQGLLSRCASGEIITAHRVQVQFYLATKRRNNIEVDRDKWLLSKEEMEKLGADSPVYRFLQNESILRNNVDIISKNADILPQSKSKSENITHTLSAPVRVSEPQAPSVEEVRAYFAARGVTDPIEITEFLRYNEARGWSCLPAWEQKANLWIAKVPKARREFSERQKRETQKAGRKPQSFDTDSFMAAALRKSYHNEQ